MLWWNMCSCATSLWSMAGENTIWVTCIKWSDFLKKLCARWKNCFCTNVSMTTFFRSNEKLALTPFLRSKSMQTSERVFLCSSSSKLHYAHSSTIRNSQRMLLQISYNTKFQVKKLRHFLQLVFGQEKKNFCDNFLCSNKNKNYY